VLWPAVASCGNKVPLHGTHQVQKIGHSVCLRGKKYAEKKKKKHFTKSPHFQKAMKKQHNVARSLI
jgi:hypothetical protein